MNAGGALNINDLKKVETYLASEQSSFTLTDEEKLQLSSAKLEASFIDISWVYFDGGPQERLIPKRKKNS